MLLNTARQERDITEEIYKLAFPEPAPPRLVAYICFSFVFPFDLFLFLSQIFGHWYEERKKKASSSLLKVNLPLIFLCRRFVFQKCCDLDYG